MLGLMLVQANTPRVLRPNGKLCINAMAMPIPQRLMRRETRVLKNIPGDIWHGIVTGAVRVARIEAGLPVCGHKDCEILFDAERITEEDVAEVIRRAEDEVFALLKTPVAAATSNSSHRAATTSPKRHRLGREDAPVPGEILNGRMIIEAAAAASRAPSGL